MRGSKKEKGRGVRIDALLGKLIKTNYVLIKRLTIKTECSKGPHPHIPRKTKLTLGPFLAGKEFYIRAWTLSIESKRGSRIFSRGAGPMDNFVFPVGPRPILRILLCEFNKFEIFQSPPPKIRARMRTYPGFFSLPRNLRL